MTTETSFRFGDNTGNRDAFDGIDFDQWRQDIVTFVNEVRQELRHLEDFLAADPSGASRRMSPATEFASPHTQEATAQRRTDNPDANDRLAALKAQIARQLDEIQRHAAPGSDSASAATGRREEFGNEAF